MDLYYLDLSPPCRAVMLTAKALGVDLNKKVVNLLEKEHLKPEFLELNPTHTVPTFVDEGFVLWESRAIQTYLVNKYGKDDSLYPNDPAERAQVDRMLYFDAATLFSRIKDFFVPVVFNGEKPNKEIFKKILEAIEYLDGFLKGHNFAVGNSITVADHSLIANIATLIEDKLLDVNKYPNLAAWVKRCEEEIPGYEEENSVGAKKHGEILGPKVAM